MAVYGLWADRTITNSFSDAHRPTLGVDFHFRRFEEDGTSVALQLWDIAGPCPGAHALCVYNMILYMLSQCCGGTAVPPACAVPCHPAADFHHAPPRAIPNNDSDAALFCVTLAFPSAPFHVL